jgi:hypothetical protein
LLSRRLAVSAGRQAGRQAACRRAGREGKARRGRQRWMWAGWEIWVIWGDRSAAHYCADRQVGRRLIAQAIRHGRCCWLLPGWLTHTHALVMCLDALTTMTGRELTSLLVCR